MASNLVHIYAFIQEYGRSRCVNFHALLSVVIFKSKNVWLLLASTSRWWRGLMSNPVVSSFKMRRRIICTQNKQFWCRCRCPDCSASAGKRLHSCLPAAVVGRRAAARMDLKTDRTESRIRIYWSERKLLRAKTMYTYRYWGVPFGFIKLEFEIRLALYMVIVCQQPSLIPQNDCLGLAIN